MGDHPGMAAEDDPHAYRLDPGVWSASRLTLYQRCPRAWWLAHKSGQGPVSSTSVPQHWRRGTAVHAALEAAYSAARDGLLTPATPPGNMGIYAGEAAAVLEETWAVLEIDRPSRLWEEALHDVVELLESLPIPRAESIVGVEEVVQETLPNGVTIKSTLDLALNPRGSWLHIRDWKTFSLLPSEATLQMRVYALMAYIRWREQFAKITAALYSVPKNREMEPIVFDENMHRGTVDLIGDIVTRAEADEECRPLPSQWCGSCEFRGQCPLYNPDVAIGPHVDAEEMAEVRDALEAAGEMIK